MIFSNSTVKCDCSNQETWPNKNKGKVTYKECTKLGYTDKTYTQMISGKARHLDPTIEQEAIELKLLQGLAAQITGGF